MKKTKENPSGAKANTATRVVCVGINPGTPSDAKFVDSTLVERPKAAMSSRADSTADWSRYADSRLRQFCLR
jgi:hypothetical protein